MAAPKDGGDPIVTHGHTMCTKVSFADVATAIADCAFAASDYPLILSLEMHCSPDCLITTNTLGIRCAVMHKYIKGNVPGAA